MLFISKGIPEKGGITAQLRIVSGGQIYTLFGLDEELWLRGRFDIAKTTSPSEEQVWWSTPLQMIPQRATPSSPAA